MLRFASRTLAATLLVAVACSSPDRSPLSPDGSVASLKETAAVTWLVTFRDDVTDVRGVAADMARRGRFTVSDLREHAARGFTAQLQPAAVEQLRADPRVLILEPDAIVQLNEPEAQLGQPFTGQRESYGLARVGGSGDGTGKTAWILDTGVDLEHPDLNTSRDCHVSFVFRQPNPSDFNGHGTHVAGTVAAIDNDAFTLGVAANAYVCSVRVLDASGSGAWSWIVAGINYVAANGALGEVANMSLGGRGANATVEKAVLDASKRVKFTLAAGNYGIHADGFTPARVNGHNIHTVSAIGSNDCLASWSNYGNPPVDYAAPGVRILSLFKNGSTAVYSGTSMAAPHVAGILLLGRVRSDGVACGDPDGSPDPIAHR